MFWNVQQVSVPLEIEILFLGMCIIVLWIKDLHKWYISVRYPVYLGWYIYMAYMAVHMIINEDWMFIILVYRTPAFEKCVGTRTSSKHQRLSGWGRSERYQSCNWTQRKLEIMGRGRILWFQKSWWMSRRNVWRSLRQWPCHSSHLWCSTGRYSLLIRFYYFSPIKYLLALNECFGQFLNSL